MSIQQSGLARLPGWAFVSCCSVAALVGACVMFLFAALVLTLADVKGSEPVAVWSILLAMGNGLVLPVLWLIRRRHSTASAVLVTESVAGQPHPCRKLAADYKIVGNSKAYGRSSPSEALTSFQCK